LNQYFSFRLNEKAFYAPGPKIFLQQYRHKADIGGSGLLPCKLTPEPHFARRKSLL
jgi:hypothetical protein